MPLNREKLEELEKNIEETLKARRPLLEVPYYICLYHPKDELEILNNFTFMELRLKSKGFSAETIYLSKLMIEILSENELLSPQIIQKEEEIREELDRDLRRVLSKEIVEKLKTHLMNKGLDHCAILLRYGALWPFIHLSHIFASIPVSIKCTLVVPYPSDIGAGFPLNEGSKEDIRYYRTEVVDLR